MKTRYGRFEQMMQPHLDYVKEHLMTAQHFNLDIASYPGKYERASLYPPELFQKYIQLLGINKEDNVVVYGRGHSGGMLFAARAWWLLKMYGMRNVVVLEGGIERWKKDGGQTTSGIESSEVQEKGDWTASPLRSDLIISYEELEEKGHFDRLDQVNFLDCRPHEEYRGTKPLAFPPNGAPGARLRGSKSVPLSDLLEATGEMKGPDEIRALLSSVGFNPSAASITSCNGGTQACLLGLALDKTGLPWRMFNGSLREVSKRKASLINEKG